MITELIVKKAQNGEEEAFNIILHEMTPLIKMLSKKYFLKTGDRDDLFQEGVMGLIKAIHAFSPDHNCSFKCFAMICIRRNIYSTIYSSNCYKQQLLNQAMNSAYVTEEEDLEYPTSNKSINYYNPEDIYINKEKLALLEEFLIPILSPMEICIFQLIKKGYAYKEIASMLSIIPKASDNCFQRIRRKIKMFLSDYNRTF
ncbi:sigma-70 family RNA polymerase sigma factor [Cetobacterium sp. SF1]|uniref:sigma-70 family RNA polymerase sigma factor n=1 Tax=Cetobacterium sp. SF1 TaxID=3417654 RepID=UPI003CFB87F1